MNLLIENMAYDKILVVENDMKEVPYVLEKILSKVDLPIEYWFNFNYSFHHSSAENFKRLANLNGKTLIVSNPSFVGADNQFSRYINLFLKLKELNIRLYFAVIYPENFYMYLLKFLSDEQNHMKKENNHRMIKEILDFHVVYEIPYGDLSEELISQSKHITYNSLMDNYIETHRKYPDKIKIKESGEIYDAYFISFGNTLEDTYITLKIPDDYNNKFKLTEIEKI